MALIWSPDTCKGGTCVLDIVEGHAGINEVVRVCDHHAAIRNGLTDAEFFARVLETNRTKNYACHEVGRLLGRSGHEIGWFVDDDDIVHVRRAGANRREIEEAIARRPEIAAAHVVVDD